MVSTASLIYHNTVQQIIFATKYCSDSMGWKTLDTKKAVGFSVVFSVFFLFPNFVWLLRYMSSEGSWLRHVRVPWMHKHCSFVGFAHFMLVYDRCHFFFVLECYKFSENTTAHLVHRRLDILWTLIYTIHADRHINDAQSRVAQCFSFISTDRRVHSTFINHTQWVNEQCLLACALLSVHPQSTSLHSLIPQTQHYDEMWAPSYRPRSANVCLPAEMHTDTYT